MMTREEFDERLLKFAREWHGDIWAAMPGSKADDLRSPAIRAALLAAYDALAARIEELEDERRIRITNLQAIESHANWQAARIAELEADRDHWRNMVNDLEHNSIYLDSIAFYEGRHAEVTARIAELEAALRAVLPWLLHEIEYPGDPVEKVANGVRALLSKEA